MTSRVARAAVLIVALGSLAAAGYVVFDAEQTLRTHQMQRMGFDGAAESVVGDLGRLKAAQQAYVAEGQPVDHWMAQAADAQAKVDRGLATLASDASGDGTRSAIQAASGVLEDFRKVDQRARQYVKSNQPLMASDVIFTDGIAASNAVGEHVATARANEAAVHEAAIEGLRWREFYGASAAGLLLALAVLLLTPVPEREVDVLTAMRALTETPAMPGKRAEPSAPPVAAARTVVVDDDVPDLEAVIAATGRRPESFSGAEGAEGARGANGAGANGAEGAHGPGANGAGARGANGQGGNGVRAVAPNDPTAQALCAAAPAPPSVDLTGAAKVCADMARVLDTSDLPGLMVRLAGVLGAPGLIVWVADRSGQVLMPLLTHGYPASAVARIGSLPTSAENATALAWRTGDVQVVPGALVAPIVTSEGCVGVLAAEVADGSESRPEVRALATIFAAQLATFLTALPSVGGEQVAAST
jgi:hypothetical protein